MKDFLRFGGAQIPCSKDIRKNVETLSKAIDWASENSVDYLVTPEGSLSGYTEIFNSDPKLLFDSLDSIEKYAAEKKVGLFLGTLWIEKEKDNELVKRNQIRFYNKNGKLGGGANKIIITGYDQDIGIVGGESPNYILLEEENINIMVCGLICNDLYGREGFPNLSRSAFLDGAKLFVHSTNAERGKDPLHDNIMNDWHNANLQMVSYLAELPVITVDNSILMEGIDADLPTSSPSGVLINGEWKVQAPRIGTQYFYYDFPLEKLINKKWK